MSADPYASFRLVILTPERTVVDRDAVRVTATGQAGVFEVLPGHEPTLCPLALGLLGVRFEEGGDETLYAIHGGFLEVGDNGGRVTVLADGAEAGDEIDLDRAREARDRAEQRLREVTDRGSDTDLDRAQLALYRAVIRIQARERESFV